MPSDSAAHLVGKSRIQTENKVTDNQSLNQTSISSSDIKKYFFGIFEFLLPALFTVVFGSFIKGQWDKEVLQKHKNETFGSAFALITINTGKLALDFIQAKNRNLGILGHLLFGVAAAIIFGVAILGTLLGNTHIAAVATDMFISGASILGVKDAVLLGHNIYKYIKLKAEDAKTFLAEQAGNVQEGISQTYRDPNLATYWQNIIKYGMGTLGSIFTLLGIVALLKYQIDGAGATVVGAIAGLGMLSISLFTFYNVFLKSDDKSVLVTPAVKPIDEEATEMQQLVNKPGLMLQPSKRNASPSFVDVDWSKGRKYFIDNESDKATAKNYVINELRDAKHAAQDNHTWYGLTPDSHKENRAQAINAFKILKSFYNKGSVNVGLKNITSFAELRKEISDEALRNPLREKSDLQDALEMVEAYENKFNSPQP